MQSRMVALVSGCGLKKPLDAIPGYGAGCSCQTFFSEAVDGTALRVAARYGL